ncbi:receptor-type tyrosine-protein phosphatase H-like [Acipenser ruthenus]|uniref:receptor-type tyrosine-protein phosphatase H-like n=1 Tax=Acipenser ruthenus TaxID=7906 RepID=UPI002740473C|nr:receptor-type tyrosine-protein phosphatase H-like [Acipenser ruthenus]
MTTTESTTTHTTTTTPVPTPAPIDCTALHWRVNETSIEVNVTSEVNNVTAIGQGEAHTATIENPTAVIRNLTPGCIYEISVWKDQYKLCSISQSLIPLPVSDLTVLPKSTTELHVNWTVPTGCNTGFIVSYNQTNAEPKNITENQTFAILTDLTPGTIYEVTVKTESNGTESSPVSSTGITLLDCTAQKWTVTETSIDVEADVPIEKVTCIQSDSQESQRAATGNLRASCTGLSPGCSYNVSIWVQDQIVCTEPQSLNAPPVTNLQVSPKSTSELAVNWADTPGCVKGYRVSANDTHIEDINGSVTSIVIEKLDPGCLYIIKVTTTANGNDSTPVYKTGTTIPLPVSDLTVLPKSTTELHVNWTVPTGCNTGFIISYNQTNAEHKKITTNQSFVILTDLTPGTIYEVTVKTESNGTQSSPVSSTGITLLNCTAQTWTVTETSIDVQAAVPIEKVTCIQSDRQESQRAATGNLRTSCTGLSPGCSYDVSIWVQDQIVCTEAQSINAPPATNLQVSPKSTSELAVNWVDTPGCIKGYRVSANDTHIKDINGSVTSTVIEKLDPGCLYTIKVITIANGHDSTPVYKTGTTNPNAPLNLISSEGTTTAHVSWSAPSSDVNYQIYTYLLSWSSSNCLNGSKVINETSASLNDLIPGSLYNVSVRSQIRDAQSVGESQSILTVPAQVSSLQCSAVSGGYSLSLDWGRPAGHWTEIEVDVSNGDIKKVKECGPVQCETRIDGLSPAQYYTLAVTTVSGEKRSFKAISIQCQTDTTGVIVGSLFGILILICLVVFLILFILRRYPDLLSSSSKDDDALEFACKKMKPIEVSKFADYFHRQQADSDIGFADEYQSLGAVGTDQTIKAALIPENRGKNRFTNVLPYDWCRVKLSAIDGEPFSDYINANYMPGYHTAKEFIAAQGPLPNTVEDFWRMAWENQVEAIVMLTNCIENTRVKCEQYWPLDYTPCTYGDISVTTSSEQKQPDWTLRDFTLKHTKSSESRTVKQFHFNAWPDHGVPDNTATLIQFRALVRKFLDNRERNGPAIVHCSAGVGRTGTLIALDSLLLQIEKEKAVGIQSFVQKMRLHRPLMVQTESQYIFLNQCMLDTIQGKNNSHPDENIYENMIYANAAAIREFPTTNGNAA